MLGLLTIGILMRKATMLRPLKGFGTFAVIQLMISWDFLVHLIRMMELISNGQSLDSSN